MQKMLLILEIALAVFALASCSESYSDMLDEYNDNFTEQTISYSSEMSVTDSDFDESEMLRDLYTVSKLKSTTLILLAPLDCDSYLWEIESGGTAVTDLGNATTNERRLSILLSDSGLKAEKVYTVTLTVTYSGKTYTDSAKLYIES